MAPKTDQPAPPNLVCFDLGGVVIRICRSWEEGCAAAGLPLRGVESRDATRHLRTAAVVEFQTGRIDGDEFARRISAIVDGVYSPEEILAVHRAWILGEYPGITTTIDRIHAAGLDTAALSNTNDVHWSMLADSPALRRIRHPHASHLLRLHKPDPAIYRAFESLVGRSGAEILFFDDLPENIDAAQEVGWHAVRIDPHADTARQVVDALRSHGVNVD